MPFVAKLLLTRPTLWANDMPCCHAEPVESCYSQRLTIDRYQKAASEMASLQRPRCPNTPKCELKKHESQNHLEAHVDATEPRPRLFQVQPKGPKVRR